MKLMRDLLFFLAVDAGIVYELIYEPICLLISQGVRIIATLTTGTWKRCKSMASESPSKIA